MALFKISLAIAALVSLSQLSHVVSISQLSHAQNAHQDFVDAHNKARAEVHVPPLKWNTTVEAYALNYANKRAADCLLEHSMGPLYGENIASGGEEMSGVDAVNMWVSEKPLYNPKMNTCTNEDDECLHYTAVVWSKTTCLGCARVRCQNGQGVFITCNYWPMGNIEGERPF